MRTISISVATSLTALAALACSASGPSADELNQGTTGSGGSSGTASGGTVSALGGSPGAGGVSPTFGGSAPSGGSVSTNGASSSVGGIASSSGGGAAAPTGGSSDSSGGSSGPSTTGGTAGATAGSGGAPAGGAPTAGASGEGGETGPYAPRTGSFKMLVYSVAKGFQHSSIPDGQRMLQDIAKTQGFEITVAQNNSEITEAALEKYEIVFFMNSTGDIFNETEQRAYEAWITKNGAFAGAHSATDTESGWAFYKEVTGQYYDQHDPCCSQANIQWEADVGNYPMVLGLPSPWTRSEEWYKFNSYQNWSSKAGFKILNKVTTTGGGTRPVSYIREWGNFRSFYTSLGHESAAFQDANVKKHIAAGIMWAVRREALIR